MGPGPSPSLPSPVMPVSTPSQGLSYAPVPSAQPKAEITLPPLQFQSFVAAMSHTEPPPVSQPAPKVMPLSGLAVVAAPQQSMPAAQHSAAAPLPSSGAPAAL